MDERRSNKLPEGVGKKIVEALKRQSGSVNKIQTEERGSSFDDLINSHISENEAEITSYKENDSDWVDDYKESTVTVNINNEYEDETFNTDYENDEESPVEEFKYHEVMDEDDLDSYDYYKNNDLNDSDENIIEEKAEERVYSRQNFEEENSEPEIYVPERQNKVQQKPSFPQENKRYNKEKPVSSRTEGLYVDTSSNIEVLMGLVSQLPSGVTRQTGAQIIRQTMEAIGFSMNKVLKEAQFAQDELAQAIRDNINTIEEYRNNIKNLEKDVQKYRRKAEELEDLISLFILSEKEKRTKNL
ncbi:MAG: hypothetical protein PHC34_05670 [Candidatus Gastranaerophilales bacterium]|nr:hypothetical protein [Candidatus Gastranaerophilales bacterium]